MIPAHWFQRHMLGWTKVHWVWNCVLATELCVPGWSQIVAPETTCSPRPDVQSRLCTVSAVACGSRASMRGQTRNMTLEPASRDRSGMWQQAALNQACGHRLGTLALTQYMTPDPAHYPRHSTLGPIQFQSQCAGSDSVCGPRLSMSGQLLTHPSR